jgi:hypothetical protein
MHVSRLVRNYEKRMSTHTNVPGIVIMFARDWQLHSSPNRWLVEILKIVAPVVKDLVDGPLRLVFLATNMQERRWRPERRK